MEETLRICRDQDVLRDYLVEEEVATIMFTLLDEQKARKFWEEDLKQEGESRLGSLVTQLMELGRIDDAFRAASNKAYRQKLYKELKIQ